MDNLYDLIIIGAGPAGLTASIYASRYGVKHIILGSILGGQISETHLIDNYPGIEDVSGFEFAEKWGKHVKKYGVEIVPKQVMKIVKNKDFFDIEFGDKEKISARSLILSTGTKRRKLNILGEQEFSGKGVSYCATCDGFFYKNKVVGVVGGSDSAVGAALYLSNLAKKVYLIYRKGALRAEPFWVNKVKENNKIEVVYNTNIVEISGQEKLEKVILDKEFRDKKELSLDGLFIEVGSDPDISYAKDLGIEMDDGGYVKINKKGETNVAGVFAAGDLTDGSDKFRQVITAAAEGAIAARSAYNFLKI